MDIQEIKDILLVEDACDFDFTKDANGEIKIELVYYMDSSDTITLGEVSIEELIDYLYKRDGDKFIEQFEESPEDE